LFQRTPSQPPPSPCRYGDQNLTQIRTCNKNYNAKEWPPTPLAANDIAKWERVGQPRRKFYENSSVAATTFFRGGKMGIALALAKTHAWVWGYFGPSIYSSTFWLALVDGNISSSFLILFESQNKTDGDRNTHIHACKYKCIPDKTNDMLCLKI
jgi:hypothetical protein